MTVSAVINAVDQIGRKRYLELGVAERTTFDVVRAGSKVGVDIVSNGADDVLEMTTDEFFAGLPPEVRFDIVFIDACHNYQQVLRDYNNAAECCPEGIVFLHDMVPPSIEYTAKDLCWDAYKLLGPLMRGEHEVRVMDTLYGLTAVLKPRPVSPHPDWENLSYDEFMAVDLPLISLEQMVHIVGTMKGGPGMMPYILNKKTETIHSSENPCIAVARIREDDRADVPGLDWAAVEQGPWSFCKACFLEPPEPPKAKRVFQRPA